MIFNSIDINFDHDQIRQAYLLQDHFKKLPSVFWYFYEDKSGVWQYDKNQKDNHEFKMSFSNCAKKELESLKYNLSITDSIFFGLNKINNNDRYRYNSRKRINIFKNKDHVAFYSTESNILHYFISLSKLSPEKEEIFKGLPEDTLLDSNHCKIKLKEISNHIDPYKKNFYTKTIGHSKVLYYITVNQFNRKFYHIYKSIPL